MIDELIALRVQFEADKPAGGGLAPLRQTGKDLVRSDVRGQAIINWVACALTNSQ